MSVLFQALDRAAKEKAAEQSTPPAAGDETGIVALFAPPPRRRLGATLRVGFLMACLGVGLAAAAYWDSPVAKPAMAAPTGAPSADETATHVSKKAGKSRPAHTKSVQSDPDGIALPVEALKEMSATEGWGHTKASKAAKRTANADKDGTDQPVAGPQQTPSKAKVSKAKTKSDKTTTKKTRKKGKLVVVTENADQPVDVALAEAHDLLDAGKTRAACQRFDQILAKEPGNRSALEGKVYALQQFPAAEAAPALRKIADAHADLAPAYAGLARAEGRRGNEAAALSAWKKAVQLDGANNLYRLSLAILLDKRGQTDVALEAYRALSKPWPKQVEDRIAYLSGKKDPAKTETSDDPASKADEPAADQP
jgi:Flp pilus assembly protein TadD